MLRVPFTPPPGLFSDNTPFGAEGLWASGDNVRFQFGLAQPIGGWTDALNGSELTGVCRNILTQSHGDGLTRIVFGTHLELQVWSSGALYDITPAGLIDGMVDSTGEAAGWGSGTWGSGTWGDAATVYYARTWSLSTYGDWVIANPRGGTIYKWEGDTASPAVAITNAPAIVTYSLTTPERQILALGCNEEVSGEFNPLCIRGCHIEDTEDWTTTPDNMAFEHILEGGGRIVAGTMIGPLVGIWTDRAVHRGQFVGNPDQAYRFDLMADHCGIIGPNAFAIYEQTAVYLGSDGQFYLWQLDQIPQILPCPIHKDFYDNLDQDQRAKVVATTVSRFGEVWFFYPDSRDGSEISRYLAYSFRESIAAQRPVWFTGELVRTGVCDAGATTRPIMADLDGAVFYHEDGTSAAGAAMTWSIRSAGQYIEEGGRVFMVSKMEPDFEAQEGTVNLYLHARSNPQATPVTHGPFALTEGLKKKDFRVSGRILEVEFTSSGATESFARIGKPVFEGAPTGRRG